LSNYYWEKEIFYKGLKAEMVDDVSFIFSLWFIPLRFSEKIDGTSF